MTVPCLGARNGLLDPMDFDFDFDFDDDPSTSTGTETLAADDGIPEWFAEGSDRPQLPKGVEEGNS